MATKYATINGHYQLCWNNFLGLARRAGIKCAPDNLILKSKKLSGQRLEIFPSESLYIKNMPHKGGKTRLDVVINSKEIFSNSTITWSAVALAYFYIDPGTDKLIGLDSIRFDHMPEFEEQPICHLHLNADLPANLPEEIQALISAAENDKPQERKALSHLHFPSARMSLSSVLYVLASEHFKKEISENFLSIVRSKLTDFSGLHSAESFEDRFGGLKDIAGWQYYSE